MSKLLVAIQDIIEQDIYNDVWTQFLDEQNEQVKRMDKLVQIAAKKQAKLVMEKISIIKKEQNDKK